MSFVAGLAALPVLLGVGLGGTPVAATPEAQGGAPAPRLQAAAPMAGDRGPTEMERLKRRYGYLVPDRAGYERAKAEAGRNPVAARPQGPNRALAPTQLVNNPGIVDNTGVPSDSTGAIGTQRYIEMVNRRFGIYNRSMALIGQGTLATLVGSASIDNVFDPQVIWDPTTNRFYYTADQIRAADGHFLLALGFSKTAAPTSAADFCKYVLDYGPTDFPDYPKLGDTQHFWVIGVNVFTGNTFTGSDIIALTKPPAGPACPAANTFGVTVKPDVKNANGTAAFTPVPANQTDTSPTGYVVARPAAVPASVLSLYTVTRAATGAAVISNAANVPVPSYNLPANAPQRDTVRLLDTSDTRPTQAVSAVDPGRGGQVGLWTQHSVQGGAGSEVRWYEINPVNRTLFQSGRVTSPSLFSFNGAVSPDRKVQGTTRAFGSSMVLNFNTSSASTHPAIKVVSKVGAGAQSAPAVVVTSLGPNIDFSCDGANEPVCRWGDYAAATPDPAASPTAARGVVFGTNMYNRDGRPNPGIANWLTRNFAHRP
jgi:hypothetical protein